MSGPALAGARGRARSRRAARVLRPVYDAAIGMPVAEGRLRLAALPALERQLATIGLVALAGLLGSLLASDLWRTSGPLHFLVAVDGRPTFVPTALYPVTLLGLALAWLLVVWGAAAASAVVRAGAAILFLAVCSPLSRPAGISTGGFLDDIGRSAATAAYWTIPGALIASLAIDRLGRWRARLRPLLLATVVGALGVLFGVQLALYLKQASGGLPTPGPSLLDSALRQVDDVLVPMVYVSAVALVVFAFDVAEGTTVAVSELGARAAKVVLVALLAVKLWIRLFPLATWQHYLETSPRGALRVVAAVGCFAAVAVAVRRWEKHGEAGEAAEETLVYGTAGALAVPLLINTVVVAFTQLLIVQFSALAIASRLRRTFPFTAVVDEGGLALALLLLLVGLILTWRRPRRTAARRGSGSSSSAPG